MTPVYSTTSLGEAYAIRSMLEAQGIPAEVENEGGAFYAVGLPSPALPLIVVCREGDAEEANRLIRDRTPAEESPDPETVLFREQVERARRAGRRSWWLAIVVLFLIPLGVLPAFSALLLGFERLDLPTRERLGPCLMFLILALTAGGTVGAAFLLRSLMRRPPA